MRDSTARYGTVIVFLMLSLLMVWVFARLTWSYVEYHKAVAEYQKAVDEYVKSVDEYVKTVHKGLTPRFTEPHPPPSPTPKIVPYTWDKNEVR